jgi:hypothetical protein
MGFAGLADCAAIEAEGPGTTATSPHHLGAC